MPEIIRSLSTFKKINTSSLCRWGIPLLFTFSYVILVIKPDLRLAIPFLIAVTSLQVILLATVYYLGEKNIIYWRPWFILFFALLFRLLFLFKDPQFSDDIYRYIWDGMQSLAGNNPYKLAPDIAPILTDAMGILREKVNHSELVTIYPPASQLIFAGGILLGKNIFGIKILLIIFDLATCFLIIRLLSILNISPYKAVLYAWHPLPIIEIAGSGHIDGTGFLFLFLALLILFRQNSTEIPIKKNTGSRGRFYIPRLFSGVLFSLSVLIKFFPLVFLPAVMLPGRLRSKAVFLTGFITGTLLLCLFYMPYLKNCFVTLDHYLHNWEFAGFAFRFLKETVSDWKLPRKFLLAVFIAATTLLYIKFYLHCLIRLPTEPAYGPDILFNLLDTLYMISFTFLLLTPTLHPWYALAMVSFLPFTAGPAGLTFSWSVFLGYQVLVPYTILGEWDDNIQTAFMIWAAPVFTITINFITRLIIKLHLFSKHINQSN